MLLLLLLLLWMLWMLLLLLLLLSLALVLVQAQVQVLALCVVVPGRHKLRQPRFQPSGEDENVAGESALNALAPWLGHRHAQLKPRGGGGGGRA